MDNLPNITQHHTTWPKIKQPTLRNVIQYHPKSPTQHNVTVSNIIQPHPINIMQRLPILPNQHYPISPISSSQHYTTSSNITTQHHPVSSNITDHQPPLSSSAQLHWTLPNITWYQPTSSNIKDVNKFSKIAITICFIFFNFVHPSSFVFAVLLFFTVFYIYCAWLNFF